MKESELETLFEKNNTNCLEWAGTCHDCKKEAKVIATKVDGKLSSDITIDGGAVYAVEKEFYIKCEDCFNADPVLRNFRVTEQYSRVVGYMRPVSSWNEAKQQEFHKRKNFVLEHQSF